jgi:hypothetical protein
MRASLSGLPARVEATRSLANLAVGRIIRKLFLDTNKMF